MVFGSSHVVEQQLLFLWFLQFLFLTFLGPNGLFLRLGWGSKTVLGSTHVVAQL